jgi:hypothetical protein
MFYQSPAEGQIIESGELRVYPVEGYIECCIPRAEPVTPQKIVDRLNRVPSDPSELLALARGGELSVLVDDRPRGPASDAPPQARPLHMRFGNGYGVRYLMRGGALRYFFDGLTDDQQFIVKAQFTLTAPRTFTPRQECGFLPPPQDRDRCERVKQEVNEYVRGSLAAFSDSDFIPHLDAIDRELATLLVEPSALTFAGPQPEVSPGCRPGLEALQKAGGLDRDLYSLVPEIRPRGSAVPAAQPSAAGQARPRAERRLSQPLFDITVYDLDLLPQGDQRFHNGQFFVKLKGNDLVRARQAVRDWLHSRCFTDDQIARLGLFYHR